MRLRRRPNPMTWNDSTPTRATSPAADSSTWIGAPLANKSARTMPAPMDATRPPRQIASAASDWRKANQAITPTASAVMKA